MSNNEHYVSSFSSRDADTESIAMPDSPVQTDRSDANQLCRGVSNLSQADSAQ